MSDPTSAGLLEIAGPQLYRRNAFRITGLPTDADRRTVRHRQQKIIPALEMGIDLDLGHTLPVEPDDVRRAFDLILGDPRRRLVDELFWLWDTPDATCGCSKAVHTDHDQAVQAHSAALDKESIGDQLSDDELDELEVLWAEASRLWNSALRRAAFWDHVRHRITALDDKQLNESVIDLLREEMPLTLVKPLIQLAARSASEPSWLAEQARSWPLPTEVIDDQLEAAAEPIYELVKSTLAEAAELLNDGDPHKAAAVVYDKVLPILKRLNALVPASRHRRTASTRNDVAVVFNNCATRLIDEAGPAADTSARKWFQAGKKLTSDPHTLALIDQNTATLNEIVDTFATIRRNVQLQSPAQARAYLRNIRRMMGTGAGVNEINRMLQELGDPTATGWEREYERARASGTQVYRRPASGGRGRLIRWLIAIGVLIMILYLLLHDGSSANAVQLFAQKSGDNAPVGTCVETREGWDRGNKSAVPSVPCDEDHWGEVIGYISLAATVPSAYPGKQQVAAQARYNCVYMQALKGLESSDYTVDFVYPEEDAWNDGKKPANARAENYATCVVHRKDDDSLPDHRVARAADSSNVVWHMDMYNENLADNPPVGACVHTRDGYRDIHHAGFIECGVEHWGEIIGYPQLALAGDTYHDDGSASTVSEARCTKLAADRGLGDASVYTVNTTWPRKQDIANQSRRKGPVYSVCTISKADGSALKGQVK